MGKIPTAEELLNNKFPEFEHLDNGNIWVNIENIMIEFAKMHVKAALKEASESADLTTDSYMSMQEGSCVEIHKDSILNSYPLENIK